MKIKYQSGGMITYTPFIPQSGTSSGSGSDRDKKNKISGTLQEKIIDVLKESGIQSDVDSFLSEANTFLTKSQHLSNMSIFGGSDGNYSMTDLIGVLSMANKVKQNKLQWDAAAVNLKDEDAWDEVAMTSTGSIYVVKDGKLSTVTSQDYYQNRDKYQALTTAQVMGLRESDPNMAFKEDVLKDMSGMISFKTITDHLVNTIDKFGSNSREEYIKKTGEDVPQSVWNGMRILIENGPNGYYKVKTQSELTNVNAALNYLMQTLGKKGRARLAAEIAVSGGDPSKDSANLIMQALQMHTQFSQSVNFEEGATKLGKTDKEAGAGQLAPESRTEMIARGYGTPHKIEIVPRVDKPNEKQKALTTTAINFGGFLTKDGEMFDSNYVSLRELLKEDPAFRAQTDAKNVTLGNIHLSPKDLDKVVVDTTWNNLSGVRLPYKEDGAGVVPDFSMIDAYDEMEKFLESKPNATSIEVMEKLKLLKIDPSKIQRVVVNGQSVYKLKTQYFLTFSAYGNNDTIKSIRDNTRFFEHVGEEGGTWLKDDAKKQFDPKIFDEVTSYGTLNHKEGAQKVFNTSFWIRDHWHYDNAYMGNVFVAVDPERAMYATENKLIEKNKLVNPLERMQTAQRLSEEEPYYGNFDE